VKTFKAKTVIYYIDATKVLRFPREIKTGILPNETAVRTAMPDFHRKMQDKLRTPEEGADTMIWLAIAKDALNKPSGMFFQGKSI
jgi:hypothetical protein